MLFAFAFIFAVPILTLVPELYMDQGTFSTLGIYSYSCIYAPS